MASGVVVAYSSRFGTPMFDHEQVTLHRVVELIAELKHYEAADSYDAAHRSGDIFFVPDDTLVVDEASSLGIRSSKDLFGGVVPYPFVKTKAITHPLLDGGTERPEGWSSAFADKVRDIVLPGYTVFSLRDAREAVRRLVGLGPVRLKPPLSCGGGGQRLATTTREADAIIEKYSAEDIARDGLVLETNLEQMMTRSVGQIEIDDATMSYHGTQRFAADNEGRLVYGGSDLICVRGGWNALDELPLPYEVVMAVEQARAYDQAMGTYPGFLASRRNYDVGQGIDGTGQRRSGVLEASWRSGGASTAELTALAQFRQNPALSVVEASAIKEFGKHCSPPRGAVVHYSGDDPRDGWIRRYTMVTRTAG